ncbi:MerR family transcriptional regulator [Fulvivirga sp. M361]|uniref:MerR family transcriptional regulator n=1 Tax=Fulvivirga sp. M361 TaxID=2594266 RepID=UPI00117A6CC0|nr:MerR family transcriptional regulator [Fulvivirga sp. M361]TRX62736.1 MerR family transcriptional regulator [Fulvivirga sp. M361]
MTKYSVKQLSSLAGVSVRTLHHYDHIGLLKPSFRSKKGYRFYERKELLLLQQILIYRQLEFPLSDIHAIIYNPSFDLTVTLETHKKKLEEKLGNLKLLIATVDKTIHDLKLKESTMTDEDIYKGLNVQEVRSQRKEVIEKWGRNELIKAEDRIKKIGKGGWKDLQKKGEEINQLLADLSYLPPAHTDVQQTIELHFRHLNFFYEVSKERYLGLGKMYTEDERFKSYYEKYAPGLAHFIMEAIQVFCDNDLH